VSGIFLKNPLAVLTPDGLEAGAGLVVREGRIAELVPTGKEPGEPFELVFDASEHVILPGLINTHHHFYQTLTRAHTVSLNKELFDWLRSLYPVWAGLGPKHVSVSTRLALVELILSGCTTASDHHYLFPKGLEQAIDIQAAQAQELGIRVVLCRGSMSLGQEEGGLPPQEVIQTEEEILADSERLIGELHQSGEGAFVQIALAPCSPFSVSEELMRGSAELARAKGVRLHTHLAETEDETRFCLETMGLRPVDYLEKVGWMVDDVWLAHGIHFTPEEIARLGRAGVGTCHCPSSNMVLASGICPTLDQEAAGAPIGLGVDGSASNDCSNMIQEVRQALLLQRLRYGSERVGHLDALRWATSGSARCLGRTDIGEIRPGKQADLALFKLDEPRFSGAGEPLAGLLLCGAHRADYVMVGGKWVVEKGGIPGLDLEELMAEHKALARSLFA
jgi:8-oxoguanine deaminase